jgi:uncharacterized protein
VTLLLSSYQAKPLLHAQAKGKALARSSTDLGYKKAEARLTETGVLFDGFTEVPWHTIEYLAKQERKVFQVEGDLVEPVNTFSEDTRWVRALAATEGAPTVFVSGKPMHRIKDTEPWADTKGKLKALGLIKGRMLDTATGLGYTAILAARTAREVVTIELDPAALEIARLNPWSQELFTNPKITQVIGDSEAEVKKLPASNFEAILHDPPTMSLGGGLYGEDFYRDLLRVLQRNGRLFHYCGDPSSGLGSTTTEGVMRRLSHAGFAQVKRVPEAFGILAVGKK